MSSTGVQSKLYTELGVYRSKVEGKRVIARKAALLAVAAAEKLDPAFLNERMADIDADKSSSKDFWSSSLALIPGKIGALGSVLGKSATLYENMESMVGGKHGGASATDDGWENQLRNDLELLHKNAENDPEFAKLVDLYLGDKLGAINASVDETLAMFPPFKDSKALEALGVLVKEDHASLESIQQNINKLKNELEAVRLKADANKKPEMSFEERMQGIAEHRIYCRLAVRVLQELNPDYAKAVGAIFQGVMDAQEIQTKLKYGKMTATAATASYILIAIVVIDAFQSKDDSNHLIFERLNEIVRLIVDLSKDLVSRLESLQATADLILKISALNLQQAIENKESLVELHKKANEIHHQIFEQSVAQYQLLQTGFERQFVEALHEAFSHKDTHKPGTYTMERLQFDESLSRFLTAAVEHASDQLALPPIDESLEEIDLQEGLFKRPLAANLPYLAQALNRYAGLSLEIPKRNFDLWHRSTAALIDLISDWPIHQKVLRPDFLVPLIEESLSFEEFFASMQCSPASPAIQLIATRQLKFANDVLSALTKQVWTNFSNAVARATMFEPQNYSYEEFSGAAGAEFVKLFDKLKPIQKLKHEYKPPYSDESLDIPEELLAFLPASIRAAWCFGFVESVEFSYQDIQGTNATGGRDHLRHLRLVVNSTVLEGKKEKWTFPLISRRRYRDNIPLAVVIGPLPDWTKTYKSRVYHDIHEMLSPPSGIGLDWPLEVLQDEAAVLSVANDYFVPLVNQCISDLVSVARRDVIEVNIGGRDAMRALIGMYELLNQYVTFGGWESVEGNEKVDELLFGSENLVFMVSGTRLFEEISVDEVKKKLEAYPETLDSALNEAIALQPPRTYELKVTQQLRDLRNALHAGSRWSSDFAKRIALGAIDDQIYSNASRSLSGSAPSTPF